MKYLILLAALLGISCPINGQDFSIISDTTSDVPEFPSIVFEAPKKTVAPVKKVVKKAVPSKSSPSWNLSGSWTAVKNRNALINHLANDGNHGQWSKEYLQTLNIQQLWYLHDTDHDSKKKVQRIEVQPYCPPGSS
jgi:hypothetical protein